MDPNAAQQPAPAVASPVEVKEPWFKRFLSKKILLIVGGIFLLLVILLVVVKVFSGKTVSNGSGDITWWGLWEDETSVQPLIDEYQKAHPKVKITYTRESQQDYRERLTNALAKGEGPDIFTLQSSWVPMFRNDLSVVPANVMSASEFTQTFYTVAVSDLTTDKGIVGIPLEYDGLTLFINQDIFDKAGKQPPKTWDELRVLARDPAFTKKDDKGNILQSGVALGRTENVDHWPEILGLLMLQNGVDLTKPQGKLAEGALSFFTQFSQVDGVWDATLPPSTTYFETGNLAMYFGPSWRVFEIKQKNPNLNFKAVPLPQPAKDDPTIPDVSYASYWVQSVGTRSTKQAAAWDFLKFLSTKDSLEKLYQNESKLRSFGEAYPRVDMASLLSDHPYLGPIISQAKSSQSWFLQSNTYDGQTGINSQINKYFEDAVNAVNSGTDPVSALQPVVTGVSQVLGQYGLVSR